LKVKLIFLNRNPYF